MELDTYERDRVGAIAVRLVNMGWFRVGSDRYARESRTYGSHLRVVGARDVELDPEELALLSLLRSWRIRRVRKAA